jgi:hypothetical protein
VNVAVAWGALPVENPAPTANGFHVSHYGYIDDGPQIPALGSNVEAQKTEPDKNTYLVLSGQHGADAAYDYGDALPLPGTRERHQRGASGAARSRASTSTPTPSTA